MATLFGPVHVFHRSTFISQRTDAKSIFNPQAFPLTNQPQPHHILLVKRNKCRHRYYNTHFRPRYRLANCGWLFGRRDTFCGCWSRVQQENCETEEM